MKTPGSEYVISICATLLLKIPLLTCYGQAKKFNGSITDKPASRWEEAMVTGNGNMGAMMYGQPDNETIVINHCGLFLPLGTKEFVKDLSKSMPEIKRAALEAGKDGPALALSELWKAGSIENILLRDQMQVKKLAWDMNSRKIELSLKSDKSQKVLLRLPEHIKVKSIQFQRGNLIHQGKSHNKNRWKLKLQEGRVAHIDIKLE